MSADIFPDNVRTLSPDNVRTGAGLRNSELTMSASKLYLDYFQ